MTQVFDEEIYDIVEKGLLGGGLTEAETLKLYQVPERSKEAAYIRWAGHAQIGLNSMICPKNCKFCSFAACNSSRKGKFELEKKDVLEYAKLYMEDGANLMLLLTTASYSFEKLLDMVGGRARSHRERDAASREHRRHDA